MTSPNQSRHFSQSLGPGLVEARGLKKLILARPVMEDCLAWVSALIRKLLSRTEVNSFQYHRFRNV